MIVKLTPAQYNMLLNERPLTSALLPIENVGLILGEQTDWGKYNRIQGSPEDTSNDYQAIRDMKIPLPTIDPANPESMKKMMLKDIKKFLDTVGSLTGYLGHWIISADDMKYHYEILNKYKSMDTSSNDDGTTGTHLCDFMELYLKEKKKTRTLPGGGTTKWSAANVDNNLLDDIEEVMAWPGTDLHTYKNKSMTLLKNTNCANTQLTKTTKPLPDQIYDCCRHEIIDMTALITAFFPGGIYVAAGMEAGHAGLYYKEKENLMAGISLIFAAIPIIGEIPYVKQLTAATIRGIVSSAQSGKEFTKAQLQTIKTVLGFKSQFKAAVGKIKTLKPEFIKVAGPEAYEKLMTDLLSKKISKTQFVQSLKNPVKSGIKQVRTKLALTAAEQATIKNILQKKGWTHAWDDAASSTLTSVPLEVTVINEAGKKVTKTVRLSVGKHFPASGGKKSIRIPDGDAAIRTEVDGVDWIILNPKGWKGEAEGMFSPLIKNPEFSLEEAMSFLYHETVHLKQPSQYLQKLKDTYSLIRPKTAQAAITSLKLIGSTEKKGIANALKEAGERLGNKAQKVKVHPDKGRPYYEYNTTTKIPDNFDWGLFYDEIKDLHIGLWSKPLKEISKKAGMPKALPVEEAIKILKEATYTLSYKVHPTEVEAQVQPMIIALIRNSKQNPEIPKKVLGLLKSGKIGRGKLKLEPEFIEGLDMSFFQGIDDLEFLKKIYPEKANKIYGDLYKQLKNLEQNVSRVVTPQEKSAVQKYISNLQKESIKNKTTIKLTETQYNKLIKEQSRFDSPIYGIPDSHKQAYRDFQKNRKSSKGTEEVLDSVQSVLDWAGLIPVYGDALDAFNAVVYFSRGKNIEGGLSVIAIIPVVGSLIAIPFKILFRALAAYSKAIGGGILPAIWKYIIVGKGKPAAQGLIKMGRKAAPQKLKDVLNIVKKNIDKIIEGLDKMNVPFAKMEKFNLEIIPSISGKINTLGKRGKATIKGFKNFFIGLSEEEAEKQTKKSLTQKRFEEPTDEPGFIKKNITDPVRVAKMSKIEKGIFKYISGYNKIDKRLKPYVKDFRYYYTELPPSKYKDIGGDGSELLGLPPLEFDKFKNLTDDEILRFLTKHYNEDLLGGGKIKGLYKDKVLAHGSNDIHKLEVIDIEKFLGANTHNIGLHGPGFYFTSSPKNALHYSGGLGKQPFIINNVNKPLYLNRPKATASGGNPSLMNIHDLPGVELSIRPPSNEELKKILSPENFENYTNVRNLKDEKGKDLLDYFVTSYPTKFYPGKSGYQQALKIGREKLIKNFKKAGIDDEGIGQIMNKVKVKEKPVDVVELGGENVMMDKVYKTGNYDLVVSNINTLHKPPATKAQIHTGTEGIYGPSFFPDAEVIIKQDKSSDVISLFPSMELITKLGDEGGSITRNLGSSNIHHESHKRKTKIKLSESQYKKILLREFGETVTNPKEWYLRVLEWVDSPDELDFETDQYEVVAYDTNGAYLGYYDKDQGFGFVVTEYGIGLEDEEENFDEEYIDEQEEGGTGGWCFYRNYYFMGRFSITSKGSR